MTVAHLKPDSEWAPLFPQGVPITGMMTRHGLMEGAGSLAGIGKSEYYEVDLAKLTPEQYAAVIGKLAAQSGLPEAAVREGIHKQGNTLPLTVRHVESVSTDLRSFL